MRVVLVAVMVLLLAAMGASRAEVTGDVGGTVDVGRFHWHYAYHLVWDGEAVTVRCTIHLVPVGGATRAEVDRAAEAWRRYIDRFWGSFYRLRLSDGPAVAIRFDVRFAAVAEDNEVTVWPKERPEQSVSWSVRSPPLYIAHEFGHLLGLYDEYPGGAVDPATSLIDATSIMGAYPGPNARPYPRHYEAIRRWAEDHIGAGPVKLEAVGGTEAK